MPLWKSESPNLISFASNIYTKGGYLRTFCDYNNRLFLYLED